MNISQTPVRFPAGRRPLHRLASSSSQAGAPWGPFDYDNLNRQFLLIEECHAEQLTAAAAQALREVRYRDAYMYADRRCRIKPIAGASDYLLRAGALSKLGEHALAHADLKMALEIDPNHGLANLTALRAATGKDRVRFATAIIRSESRSPAAHEAIETLATLGYSVIGVFTAAPAGILGWCVWKGGTQLPLQVSSNAGSQASTVAADPAHPLRSLLGHAADIAVEWPDSATYASIDAPGQQRLIVNGTLLRPDFSYYRSRTAQKRERPGALAVIVPVYGDPDATERCLASLAADYDRPGGMRVILVNDASPNPQIHALVAAYAQLPDTSVLTHKINLGFARSVNDALATLDDEDVIVVNADTVLPAGFASRLQKAAYSSSNIGTVTPLSNNGEYTSFPVPFRENPLPHSDEILALDRIAASVNAGRTIDMPNGTAFCMYVTRACLAAIGPLSTSFGKGYYEDVEFCLRAAKAGFRNVCAADLYVGHAGSRSFGTSKRALVARNLAALEIAHPNYRAVSAAFMEVDPLAPARYAIETAALKRIPTHLLLVADDTADGVVTRRCAALGKGDRVLVAKIQFVGGTISVRLSAPNGAVPQNIVRHFFGDSAAVSISAWFEELGVERVDFIEFETMPAALTRTVLEGPFKIGCLIPCDWENVSLKDSPFMFLEGDSDGAWISALSRVDTLLALDDHMQHSLVAQFGAEKKIEPAFCEPQQSQLYPSLAPFSFDKPRLGVIGGSDAATHALVGQLIANAAPPLNFETVFIGAAFDDLRLMASGRIFCTGEVDPAGLPDVLRLYQVSHILIAGERISHIAGWDAALAVGLPRARMATTAKRIISNQDGLIIPVHASIPTIADALNRWTTLQPPEAAYG